MKTPHPRLGHRLGLVAAGSLVLVGGVTTAAGASSNPLHATVHALRIGDAPAPPADAPTAPDCTAVPAIEIPAGELPPGAVLSGSLAQPIDGVGVSFGVATSDGVSVTVGADGTVATTGEVPQEIVDSINADTDALVAHLHDAGFDVEVTTDASGIRAPQLDPEDEALMSAVQDYYEANGPGGIAVPIDGDATGVVVSGGSSLDVAVDAPADGAEGAPMVVSCVMSAAG